MNTNNHHNTNSTNNAGGSSRTLQAPTANSSRVMTVVQFIGNRANMPNWPTNDIDGLFDALTRWALDFRQSRTSALDMALRDPEDDKAGPFRGRAWCGCDARYDQTLGRVRYYATRPMYPDYPEAVSYTGNFLGYSFCFVFDTNDPELIARLDAAIAANMQRPDYQAAEAAYIARKGY